MHICVKYINCKINMVCNNCKYENVFINVSKKTKSEILLKIDRYYCKYNWYIRIGEEIITTEKLYINTSWIHYDDFLKNNKLNNKLNDKYIDILKNILYIKYNMEYKIYITIC